MGEFVKFSEFLKQWKRYGRFNVSTGWRKTQDIMLKLHILPILGGTPLSEIKPQDISKILEASRQKGHAPNTTKQIYLLLSKMFNDAVDFFDILDRTPVRRAHHSPKVPKKEIKFLQPNEVQTLLEFAKYHWSIQAIVLQVFIGLRVSEVIALKWKDIDFNTQSILIRSKWNRKTKEIDEYPKNKKQARLPFRGDLIVFLTDLKNTMNPSPDDFVCTGASGKGMMTYNSYQKTLFFLCAGAGVPRVTTHGFRHTCSMLWKRQGANIDDRKLLLNHDSIVSTKTYDHDDDFRLQQIAPAVMNIFKK